MVDSSQRQAELRGLLSQLDRDVIRLREALDDGPEDLRDAKYDIHATADRVKACATLLVAERLAWLDGYDNVTHRLESIDPDVFSDDYIE